MNQLVLELRARANAHHSGPGPSPTAQLCAEAADRLEVLEAALTKVDAIRNSIIGCQSINWSEHIYPLVAALGEAGFEGEEYETARKNVGTLIEQIKAAEALIAPLAAVGAELVRAEAGEEWKAEIPDEKAIFGFCGKTITAGQLRAAARAVS